jgi:hypothetical protein
MSRRLFQPPVALRVAALLAALICAVQGHADTPKAAPASKRSSKATSKGLTPAELAALTQLQFNEAELLRGAYVFLSSANASYAGHRAKAMTEIQTAIKMLDASILKNGTPQQIAAQASDNAAGRAKAIAKSFATVYTGQALSDAQLRAASGLLVGIEPALKTNKQTKVLTHVHKAAKEIVTALKTSKAQANFNEAELLREAYILVATANPDSKGHTAKAMTHLRKAITILDKSVMKDGTPLEKSATQALDNAAVIAKHVPAVFVNQAKSDAQLRAAAGLLLQVELVLALSNQTNVLGQVDRAGNEIVTALNSR